MKKMLMVGMIFILLVVMLVAALPVAAAGGISDGPPEGKPGWSHVNPGNGGSDIPGPGSGPGGG